MKKGIIYIMILLSLTTVAQNRTLERKRGENFQNREKKERRQKNFDMVQTLSEGAQTHTIAFSALAFYTGSPYSSGFYPPGKVADFFGFQFMRDNDLSESGHNTDFLTKAAWHTMTILNEYQMKELIDLAVEQEQLFNDYALKRLILVDAFHRYLEGNLPKNKSKLNLEEVKRVSRELYIIDAEISCSRAVTFSKVINSLSAKQVAEFQKLGKQGMQSWSMPERPEIQIPRGLNVWVMSNASEMFSWYLRDVQADIYFCPERHGTYFGGFYMKDAPAVGNAGYAIDPQITASKGYDLLNKILTPQQAEQIREIYQNVKNPLQEIVNVRGEISRELRVALDGKTPDKEKVKKLCARYGELDGEYIYQMAETFVQVGRTLTPEQKSRMVTLRDLSAYPEKIGRTFLYSKEVDMPAIKSSDDLFE